MGSPSRLARRRSMRPSTRAATPAAAQNGDESVVTGSRIAKSEFTSADPIQVIDPENAKLQGQVQLADVLQSTPAAQGSIQITSAIKSVGEHEATVRLRDDVTAVITLQVVAAK